VPTISTLHICAGSWPHVMGVFCGHVDDSGEFRIVISLGFSSLAVG
jgi:hypothetical protein